MSLRTGLLEGSWGHRTGHRAQGRAGEGGRRLQGLSPLLTPQPAEHGLPGLLVPFLPPLAAILPTAAPSPGPAQCHLPQQSRGGGEGGDSLRAPESPGLLGVRSCTRSAPHSCPCRLFAEGKAGSSLGGVLWEGGRGPHGQRALRDPGNRWWIFGQGFVPLRTGLGAGLQEGRPPVCGKSSLRQELGSEVGGPGPRSCVVRAHPCPAASVPRAPA